MEITIKHKDTSVTVSVEKTDFSIKFACDNEQLQQLIKFIIIEIKGIYNQPKG